MEGKAKTVTSLAGRAGRRLAHDEDDDASLSVFSWHGNFAVVTGAQVAGVQMRVAARSMAEPRHYLVCTCGRTNSSVTLNLEKRS